MTDAFIAEEFVVPKEFVGVGFRLEPLGSQHNERDHDAWMSSIEHIRASPGYPAGPWPSTMSLEENLTDLVRHADDFASRIGFTYSVLDGDDVIGCVYIYPSRSADHDAAVKSWVRESRAELDAALRQAIAAWLQSDWPFQRVDYAAGT